MSYYDVLMRIAVTVKRFKMFPVFEVAHFILICASVREFTLSIHRNALAKDAHVIFPRAHPLASWFSSLLMCFSGSFIGNFLLGEPLITPLQNTQAIVYFTVIWYLINYCPFDVFSKFCEFLPVKVVLNLLREIRRVNGIDQGMNFALKVMPDSHVIPLAFGVLKGTAASHMKVFQRLICGVWQPSSIEILNPSIVTKSCLIGSMLLLLAKTGNLDFLPESLLLLLIIIFFLIVRTLYYFDINLFVPVENLLGCLLTGGIIDSFRRAVTPPGSTAAQGSATMCSFSRIDRQMDAVSTPPTKDDIAGKPASKSKKED